MTNPRQWYNVLVAQSVQELDSAGATYPVAQAEGEEVPFPLHELPSGHDEQLLAPTEYRGALHWYLGDIYQNFILHK